MFTEGLSPSELVLLKGEEFAREEKGLGDRKLGSQKVELLHTKARAFTNAMG
jgi:hypothetical protein